MNALIDVLTGCFLPSSLAAFHAELLRSDRKRTALPAHGGIEPACKKVGGKSNNAR